jgi:hypothetical protein
MIRSFLNYINLLTPVIFFSLIGCAGLNRGTLLIVETPTETQLHGDWKTYTVYYRRNLAFVYKLKNDQKIILDNSWVSISSEAMMTESKIRHSTWVKEIRGENNAMFGYLVHRNQDLANVKIIDQNTVQLFYNFRRTSGR